MVGGGHSYHRRLIRRSRHLGAPFAILRMAGGRRLVSVPRGGYGALATFHRRDYGRGTVYWLGGLAGEVLYVE